MPKVIILMLIMLYFYKELTWFSVLFTLLISIVVVSVFHILEIYLHGKFYLSLIKKGKHVPPEKIYSVVHRYMGLVNKILRVNVIVYNYEYFDKSKNYLITPNHQSNADITVLLEAFKSPLFFAAKSSLSKVILVKDWMKLLGCLFLKKNDIRSQIVVMNEVAYKLKNGESVIIFPEGKRSFSATMNDFKAGTFKMATKTKVDILPVTINHIYKIRKHFPWRGTEVHVTIHEPLNYEDYKELGTKVLANKVQQIIENKIEYH